MNALEDTRELVTTTSAPDSITHWSGTHSALIAGFVDDLIHQYPDVELATIRISELDGVITVTGRRGRLVTEPERVGPPAYVERPDGTTSAATQCIAADCRYPNPHTHPDLVVDLVGHLRDAVDRARERRLAHQETE